MDTPKPISPTDLYLELGTANAPVLIDVRTDINFDPDDRLIVGALRLPDNVDSGRPISPRAAASSFMTAKATRRARAWPRRYASSA
jgi:hypothetical protein